jgi:hypothetical protein
MIFLLKIRPKKCRENGVIGFLLALALDISYAKSRQGVQKYCLGREIVFVVDKNFVFSK